MDVKLFFKHTCASGVHWIWGGGISVVYEIHPQIVVKVPKSGDLEKEQFNKELQIYQMFSQNPPCPSIVQCFYFSKGGIFLEYMRGTTFTCASAGLHVSAFKDTKQSYSRGRNQKTMVVTSVNKLEPLSIRKEWMNDLAQAASFLESLNLTHGDLRPENILLDRNRLKLSDFDCTATIGTHYEACMAPYGRILSSDEPDQGERGTFGLLGSRTELFSLGSLYYLINYGFEVYGDRCLTEDLYDHGPKVVQLLKRKEFPKLYGDPMIDNIIHKCWHNQYAKVSDLAAHTKTLMNETTDATKSNKRSKASSKVVTFFTTMFSGRWLAMERMIKGIWYGLGAWWRSFSLGIHRQAAITERSSGDDFDEVVHNSLGKEFSSKREFCQDLENRGLLDLLSSGEPEQLGFKFDWYRHCLQG